MTKRRVEVPTPPENLKSCCRRTFLDAVTIGRRLGRWEGYEIGVDVGYLKRFQSRVSVDDEHTAEKEDQDQRPTAVKDSHPVPLIPRSGQE